MNDAANQRLDRLVGKDSVAGIDLAALFRAILTHLQDNDTATVEELTKVVQSAITNHARIEYLYGSNGRDPWSAFMDDALQQLAWCRYVTLAEADDAWQRGPKFGTGKRMAVIPARKDRHASVGVVIYPVQERQERGTVDRLKMERTHLLPCWRKMGQDCGRSTLSTCKS